MSFIITDILLIAFLLYLVQQLLISIMLRSVSFYMTRKTSRIRFANFLFQKWDYLSILKNHAMLNPEWRQGKYWIVTRKNRESWFTFIVDTQHSFELLNAILNRWHFQITQFQIFERYRLNLNGHNFDDIFKTWITGQTYIGHIRLLKYRNTFISF